MTLLPLDTLSRPDLWAVYGEMKRRLADVTGPGYDEAWEAKEAIQTECNLRLQEDCGRLPAANFLEMCNGW